MNCKEIDKEMSIYFRDLNEEAQKRLLEFLGVKNEEEANLDVFPLFIIHKPEVEL